MAKNELKTAIAGIVRAQKLSNKPLAIVLAGHNGSGKSTFWKDRLASSFEMPLINADRMMMSILPEDGLPPWAITLRDTDESWQRVAQQCCAPKPSSIITSIKNRP